MAKEVLRVVIDKYGAKKLIEKIIDSKDFDSNLKKF